MPSKSRLDSNDRPTKRARLETSSRTKGALKQKTKPLKGKDSRPDLKAKPAHRNPHPPKPRLSSPGLSKQKSTPTEKTSDSKKASTSFLPKTFKIVAGSYEKLLYGLEGSFFDENDKLVTELKLSPLFIFPAHVSSLKAIAASPDGGKWLATGSTDEIIKVWDLRRKKEVGGLVQHQGSVTHLSFPSRSYLVSASDDGTICLFRSRDWVLLRTLNGHKGRVNCVSVHPSGKAGLSVGKDRTLHMWDLMRGKGSAGTKLGKEGELVRWSLKGDRFVVQSQATIDVYTTNMALVHAFTHPSRVHDVKFCHRPNAEGELLLVAGEDKKVTIYDPDASTSEWPVVAELIGHTNRVKSLDILEVALPTSPDSETQSTTIVATASSDGRIHVYNLASLATATSTTKVEISPVGTYDTNASRLICCALAEGESSEVPKVLRKRTRTAEEQEQEEDSEEEGVEETENVTEEDDDVPPKVDSDEDESADE